MYNFDCSILELSKNGTATFSITHPSPSVTQLFGVEAQKSKKKSSFECLKWKFMGLAFKRPFSKNWRSRTPDIHYFPFFQNVHSLRRGRCSPSSTMIYEFKIISMDNWQLYATLHHFLPSHWIKRRNFRCHEMMNS